MQACFCSCVGSKAYVWLLTRPTIPVRFILGSFFYNITYPSWLATSYNCESFTMSMWSYHWLSKYPSTLVSSQEWMYHNPWHILGYYCNYCFREWSTCLKGGFPPFPSPHPTTNGYPYHQIWLLYFDGRCHCLPNLHKYCLMSINDDITCNDDGYLREDTIIRWASTRRWLHSPCYWNVWMFLFLFWFIFYHLCTDHYRTSSAIFFSPFDVYFLLSIAHVHNLIACANHSNSSMGCYTWSNFLISFTHHN